MLFIQVIDLIQHFGGGNLFYQKISDLDVYWR